MGSPASWNQTASAACASLAVATKQGGARLDDGELYLLAKIVEEQTALRLQSYRFEDESGLVLRAISRAEELPGDIEAAMMEADEIDKANHVREQSELAMKRGVYWAHRG